MDYIEKYKKRLQREGNNPGEVLKNNTISFMNNHFTNSPSYRLMEVVSYKYPDITQVDARTINVERLGNLREVLLKPGVELDIGVYLKFDGDTWLAFDKWGGEQSIYIKLLVTRCNYKIKWIDKDGNLKEYDCVASTTDLGSKAKQGDYDIEWNKYDVRLPLGQLFVSAEANPDIKSIELNDRFIFGKNVYEVIGIDDITGVEKDGYGYIQFTMRITTKREEDDFVNGVAFNEHPIDKDETTIGEEDIKGGKLW